MIRKSHSFSWIKSSDSENANFNRISVEIFYNSTKMYWLSLEVFIDFGLNFIQAARELGNLFSTERLVVLQIPRNKFVCF